MDDILQDIKDKEAMKNYAEKVKQSKEVLLFAGGKALHDKFAVQIGNAKPIGGQVSNKSLPNHE